MLCSGSGNYSYTIDVIFILNTTIHKVLSSKQRLFCDFIDIKVPFDNVYRNAL